VDVLVNNAAKFYGCLRRRVDPAQIQDQPATGLLGTSS
jgi:hypothetical protein